MTTITSGEGQIEHYLFFEMSEDAREKFEEQLFADEEFFYEVARVENDLVDRYVRRELRGKELLRFERSLSRNPSRASKVANAAALQQFVREEREGTPQTEESVGFWHRVKAGLFGMSGRAYAAVGLLLMVTAAAIFLLIDNRRRGAEIARLETELANANRTADIDRQLSESRSREADLQRQVDSERSVGGDLTADLEAERAERTRLERELARVRAERPDIPKQSPKASPATTIATITLQPIGARGGGVSRVNLNANIKRVSVLLILPNILDPNERLSVRLNGTEIARNVAVRTGTGDLRTLSISVNRTQLRAGENRVTAHDSNGKELFAYVMTADKENR